MPSPLGHWAYGATRRPIGRIWRRCADLGQAAAWYCQSLANWAGIHAFDFDRLSRDGNHCEPDLGRGAAQLLSAIAVLFWNDGAGNAPFTAAVLRVVAVV